MNQKELNEYKKKLNNLSKEDKIKRELYLKDLKEGIYQGPLTGYPLIDKPSNQFYRKKSIKNIVPDFNLNIYDYFMSSAPDDICLIEYGEIKYYKKDIKKEAHKYMKLFQKMGIKKGSSVSFIMLDTVEPFIMWLALAKMGAIANLIKFDEGPDRIKLMNDIGNADYMFVSEVPFIIDNVIKSLELGNNLKKIICVPVTFSMKKSHMLKLAAKEINEKARDNKDYLYQFSSYIKEMNDNKEKINALYEKDSRFISFKNWLESEQADKIKAVQGKENDTSVIVYTGGTTGSSKGVELSNKNIIAMAHTFNNSEIGFDKGKTSLNILPPGPAYYLNATYALMTCGVKVTLIPFFKIEEYPNLIKKYKPNIFLSGPILLKNMVEKNIIKDGSFITSPISGGDKLHLSEEESINNYLKEINSKAVTHQGYGESESTAAASYSKDNSYKLGSIGIPLRGVEIGIFEYKTLDEQKLCGDKELMYNEVGEICITGPTIMKGYKDNKIETEKVLRLHEDGKYYLHTDDLGYIDSDGRLFHCGRAKRMLTREGAKVWLGSLEDNIKKIENVKDCCCVKMDDLIEREVPVAHIIFIDNSKEKVLETINKIKENILNSQPITYLPKYFVLQNEIPITEVNKKVDYKKLENEDILNSDKYVVEEDLILPKIKTLKKN